MPKLLIVDDDVELCELVAEYLAPEGFEVESVHDGARGADLAPSGDYDIVILDVMLPGMNGLDALRAYQRHPLHLDVMAFNTPFVADVASVDFTSPPSDE